MSDPTARLSSNRPFPVTDNNLMPEGVAEKLHLLCHIRKTPNVLYGIFLEITRQFYSDNNNIPIEICAHWDSDPTKSSIWIDTEYKWEDATIEKRPAIYIKLSEITYSSLTGRHDSQMSVDLEQGEYKFTRNGTGTVSWVHIGSSKGEAVAIAGSTLDYLDAFSKIIRDDFNFQSFEVTGISPMQVEKESKERFRSVVTASFVFQDTWSLKLESPKLKTLVFRAGQELLDSDIL